MTSEGLPRPRAALVDLLAAATLSLGAPLGLVALRAVRAGRLDLPWLRVEVSGDLTTYTYVLVSTGIVFSAFGYVLGRQADRLSHISITDPLTGLRNRRYFQERLEEEFARARRYGTPLSLLVIDLDDLKELNDRHGHRAGDLALQRAAAAVRSSSRAADIAARWGGDEFVLLAPSTGEDEAGRLAERIREFAAAEASPGRVLTLSVGLSILVPGRSLGSPEFLVAAADAALYEAKRRGRNRVVVG